MLRMMTTEKCLDILKSITLDKLSWDEIDAVNYVITMLSGQSVWRDTHKELPERNKEVLVAVNNLGEYPECLYTHYFIAYYVPDNYLGMQDKDYWAVSSGDEYTEDILIRAPDYWMPIPEAPDE